MALSDGEALAAVPGGWPGLSMPELTGLLTAFGGNPWGPLPVQQSGTARGHGHTATAASTRAGIGAGHRPGQGKGQLPAYADYVPNVVAGASVKAHGFDAQTSVRVPGSSTATSTYFVNADGSHTRRLYQSTVNYRDAGGGWLPIDTALDREAAGGWREHGNSVGVQFAAQADGAKLATLTLDKDHSVTERLNGAAHVTGTVSGSTITYAGVLPGTDMKLTPTARGDVEEMVLHSAAAAAEWTYDLTLHGLSATLADNGGVDLSTAAGTKLGQIAPGQAWDSNVDKLSGAPATTDAVAYKLTTTGGHTRLVVTLDAAWLHDPARVFPVTVDPSTGNWQTPSTTYAMTNPDYPGDHSTDNVINVGSYDSGTHKSRSFLQFPNTGIDGSGVTVSSASLSLFDTWATVCTAERFDVAAVTQAWAAPTVTSWPGPTYGASIGNLTPTVTNACHNTGADRSIGDWVTVPLATGTFSNWSTGAAADYGLALYAVESNTLTWKRFGSANLPWGAPYLTLTYTGVMLPEILTQSPANGYATPTLTPALSAIGTEDFYLANPVKFDYKVLDAGGALVVDSGPTAGSQWVVPQGKLRWGQTYFWLVQAYDGANYSPNPLVYQLSTKVPQPSVTSALSQNSGGKGFDAAAGNYTTTATDADVASVGPSLSVVRDYNSRDPRTTGAFGAAWSSVFDMRAVERYNAANAVSTVVVTYPDGSEVGFGRNADGSFTAGQGRAATLIRLAGGYELIDKADTTYTFTQSLGGGAYGVASVADANARAANFTWASGKITTMTSAVSGRALHLTWTTPVAPATAHIASVATDALTTNDPYVWNYSYTGDQLTTVCPPGTTVDCTRYGYSPNPSSQFRNQVTDEGAVSYWPLAETSGTTAYSTSLVNEGTDNATYANVTYGVTGPLAGSSAKAVGFNGTTSMVQLPNLHLNSAISQSVSLWFNAPVGAPAGVLYGYSDMKIYATAHQGNSMPAIYLGTDGKLIGEFWGTSLATLSPIMSTASYADGQWHHVVLTGDQGAQKMYVDGAQAGSTIPGWGALGLSLTLPTAWQFAYLGVGYLGPDTYGTGLGWPDEPHSASTDTEYATYFKGSIADAAYFDTVLSAADVAALNKAGRNASTLLTSVKRPSQKTFATIAYDPVSAAVTSVTDENGGAWTVSAPSVAGSSQVYRASVLGARPTAYYRLGEAAGVGQAASEVKYPTAAYANVNLGATGRFADEKAATFNGTTSSLGIPSAALPANGPLSAQMWFNTTHPTGIMLATQSVAMGGGTSGSFEPMLWVGSDGKLYGGIWTAAGMAVAASGVTVTDGKWHQVTLTGAGTNQVLYLDGKQVATKTATGGIATGALSYVYAGTGHSGAGWTALPNNADAYFNGTLGEVALYPSQLTAAQVAAQYDAAQNSYGLAPLTTVTVTDPGAKTLTYQYDPRNGNRVVATVDGRGAKTSYGYDTSGFLSTLTDANGDVTTTGHDTEGNPVSKTTCQNQATNTCSTTYTTYQPNSMGLDVAKSATVTSSGNLNNSSWNPAALVDGNTTSVAGAIGYSSTAYTAAANTAWVQLDLGTAKKIDQVSLYPRNDSGNVGLCFPQAFTVAVSPDNTTWTTVTTQSNYAQPTTPSPATFGFAPMNVRYVKVTATTLRKDSSANYYLQFSEITALSDRPDPTAGELLTSRDGRSVSASDNTFKTTYGYDTLGDLTSVTTPPVAGFPAGRTSTIAYTDGTTVAAADSGYAPAGLPYRMVSPGGAVNAIVYNHNGDIATTTDADGLITRYAYDALGRVATKTIVSDTFPAGLATTYAYDGHNQVTDEVDPAVLDRVTGFTHIAHTTTGYDVDGDVTSQSVADDGTAHDTTRTQTATFNAFDQVDSQVDATPQHNTTHYTYDAYGRRATETDPQGTQTLYTYDANGNLLTRSLANFTGDPVSPSAPTALLEESRAYDPAGRLQSVTNAMGFTSAYAYTDDGLQVSVTRTDQNGQNAYIENSVTYDAAGNVLTRTTNNGATVSSFTVDAASRQTGSVLDPGGVARRTTIAFTPDDQVATMTRSDATGASQVATMTYDAMGQMLSRSTRADGAGHPLAWWRLNQAGGSVVTDASGTGNAASASAGVTWSGGTASFNGTSGAVTTNGPVLSTTTSFTVSAWVDLGSAAAATTVAAQDGTNQSAFYLQYDPGSTAWRIGAAASDAAAGSWVGVDAPANSAVVGSWQHLVGEYDSTAGTLALFVNGAAAGSVAFTTPWQAAGAFTVGRAKVNGAAAQYFNGQIANVQVYQRKLSGTEVAGLYAAGRTGSAVASSTELTTSWTRDRRGLPKTATDQNQNVTTYNYDEAGRLSTTVAPAITAEVDGVVTNSVSPVITRGYNAFGELVEGEDSYGHITRLTRDARGRAVAQILPDYTQPGTSTILHDVTTVNAYDAVGNLTSTTDPLGHATQYLYDQLGDLARVTAPDGGITHYTYDANGDRMSATDPMGAQTQATYDHLGRQVTATVLDRYPSPTTSTTTRSYAASASNPGGAWLASVTTQNGAATRYAYDKAGETTSVTDVAANTTTQYAYDFLGRATRTTAPDGSAVATTYDVDGHPLTVSTLDSFGATTSTRSSAYDADGNVLSTTDALGHTTTFAYDALNELVQESQPTSATHSIVTTFGYDLRGNRTRYTDGRGKSWLYGFNSWNLAETVTEPATANYSTDGDRKTVTTYREDGRAVGQALPGGVTLAVGYDNAGRVTSQSGGGAEAATAGRSFTFDLDGRLTQAATTGTLSAETFTYNDRGEMLTAAGSGGASSFGYNTDGLMTSRQDASGTTGYGYDGSDRLSTITDAATGTGITLGYNTLSQIKTIQYATGDLRTLAYDPMHRLGSDTLTNSGATVASIGYGYDPGGNETSKTTTGFGSAAGNVYGYDWAGRLTSWNNGTTTVNYGYDDAGNRTQVGADVYTYDARDELTGDGYTSYVYTARGTMTSAGATSYTTDAYGQTITAGTQTYAYDAVGRVLTDNAITFSYSGIGNTLAADNQNTYSRDPNGGLVGIGLVGGTTSDGELAYTDAHTDVVGDFKAAAATLAGSAAYDPLGNVLARTGLAGQLGYQSGWTDQATGKVNMAARWYNPATGQFMNKDTAGPGPVPNSAAANPFAYVGGSPLRMTDPSGHGWWGSFTGWVSDTASSTWNSVTSAASATWNWVSDKATSFYDDAKHSVTTFVDKVKDKYDRTMAALDKELRDFNREMQHMRQQLAAWKNEMKAKAEHFVSTAYHKSVDAVKTAGTFVKNHAAAIGSFVVSTAVFLGCEAVLGAATGGVGAVAGAVACGALSGAVGGLFTQAANCFDGKKGACSAGAFLKAGLIGGAVGGLSGLGGALGGKLLSAVGGRVLGAVGGLFSRGGAEAVEGLATDATETAVAETAEAGGEGAATSAAEDAGQAGKAGERPSAEEESGPESEAGESDSPSCEVEVHSFVGPTKVLMADGSTKRIDEIKAGDTVANAAPEKSGTLSHKVDRVIVTTTDHDFVDLTIKDAQGTGEHKLTTTYHHAFFDKTKESFVEAAKLEVGDRLQTTDGTATVTGVRLYHATQVTYDLTIDGLHTYFVLAGDVAVLVHNAKKCGRAPAGHNYRGGQYKDLKDPATGNNVPGTEINHMPSSQANTEVFGIPEGQGLAIQMDEADHVLTESWGRGYAGELHRAEQMYLLRQGRLTEALDMDILNIKSMFGNKYDAAMNEMLGALPDYLAAINKAGIFKGTFI
ncbi:LamG-like jellyroll fold domain-containing protein [Hamadaea tsunoensis]|uniref:LamG-like jellyroll fold domain-containing protein n=1 Tax=Hamadaea tsunoensis TaxID=53368 RepID=UPI00068671A7|nr:LamG-like jellyroll fold domain-containing protein [Hamadaea tsunoensis]